MESNNNGFYARCLKRVFDSLISLCLLVLLSPLLLLLTLTGALAMGGNPFFTQPRPGRIDPVTGTESIFLLLKFRSMSNKKDESGKLLSDAQRLNSYGRFLRKTSLDEIPQLLNVLSGSCALVGPRPQLIRDMVFMTERQRLRHSVRPGITGLAQIKGRNSISWDQKFEYDLQYIENGITLWGDMKILFRTFLKVFYTGDVVRKGTATDMDYGDWLLAKGRINLEQYRRGQEEATAFFGKGMSGNGKTGWHLYNHALIPDCAPNETAFTPALDNPALWKAGRPLLARWTEDFDCGTEKSWWYCVCDKPFDLQSLKSKRRTVIRNALKYCEVLRCNPMLHEAAMLEIYNTARSSYTRADSRPQNPEAFHRNLKALCSDPDTSFYLCFFRENGCLIGYSIVKDYAGYCAYQVQKVLPSYERFQPNAALVHAVLEDRADRLGSDFYVCDGARNVNHDTNFQAYLEKYFGFRKAYCCLRIRYRRGIGLFVHLLYPMRAVLRRMDRFRFVHLVNSVLIMETIRRENHG